MNINHQVLIFTKNPETIKLLQNYLRDCRCTMEKTDVISLITHVCRPYKNSLIIIDLDGNEDDYDSIIEAIKSVKTIDNSIPVLLIHSGPLAGKANEGTLTDYILHKNHLNENLPLLLRMFFDFKQLYDTVKECQGTIDLLNSRTDKILNDSYCRLSLEITEPVELLLSVIASNRFLYNKPEYLSINTNYREKSAADIYQLNNNVYEKIESLVMPEKKVSGYANEVSGCAGEEKEKKFFSNCTENELQDIDDYNEIFYPVLLKHCGTVKNFCGYQTVDMSVFAYNYNDAVTSNEADIIKSLCINLNLIGNIFRQIKNVNEAFIYTVEALARAAEKNDDDTGQHIKRVNAYAKILARELGMGQSYIDTINYSAQMHDVGKIHIPKDILRKPGRLNDEEFRIIQEHTIFGFAIIGDSENLKMAAEIAISHHEKYDGTGYPYRLAGENIPLSARIVALADIYDALRSVRPYKKEFTHKEAHHIITKGDGRVIPAHFDPAVLNVFRKNHLELDYIYEKMR